MPRQLEEAERRTNEIIFEDRAVAIRFGTAEELAESGIRKKVEREGILRAIEIEGFDRQPCGGTHLARTGQAGCCCSASWNAAATPGAWNMSRVTALWPLRAAILAALRRPHRC